MDVAGSTAQPARAGQSGRSAEQDAAERQDGLSEREADILDFERQWWKFAGAKEQAIRDRFGLSATRYYQMLNRLIERRAAMEADPMLVKRLRKTRAARQRARAARKLGIELP